MPPKIESGDGAFGASDGSAASADVPQLPKAIRCDALPQCDSFRDGLGCPHAMSKVEMIDWLTRIRSHRIKLESEPVRRKSAATEAKTARAAVREAREEEEF